LTSAQNAVSPTYRISTKARLKALKDAMAIFAPKKKKKKRKNLLFVANLCSEAKAIGAFSGTFTIVAAASGKYLSSAMAKFW